MNNHLTLQGLLDENQRPKVMDRILSIPDSGLIEMPSQYIEQNRVIPSSVSEHYGKFDWSIVPHWKEPLDRLHPDDPTTHVAIMKSVQAAATTSVAENGMAFFLSKGLGSVVMFTSDLNIAKIRSSANIDPLIDNSDLKDKVKPISQRMKRKTADTSLYKEFSGGSKLLLTAYRSVGSTKSNTFHLVVLDEWDEAGAVMSDQGDIGSIIEGRTMGVSMFKILSISTPTRMETSRIYKNFIQGDQRRYFVYCPICGDPQILTTKTSKTKHGLTFSMMKDKFTGARILDINSIRYICKHCHGEFYEAQKPSMLKNGVWRPTWQETDFKPKSKNHKSYHSPGLLSPFLSWARYCQEFVNTKMGEDIPQLKNFTINYEGLPWAKVETNHSWQEFKKMAEDYRLGECPDGVLRLYGGVDIQGDRIELAIIGIGKGFQRYLIDYKIFYGKPEDIEDPCWSNLAEFCYSAEYSAFDCSIGIARVAVDIGYDPKQGRRDKDWNSKAHTVHLFVGNYSDKFIAVKGAGENKHGDIVKEVRVTKSAISSRFDINTPMMKEIIFRKLKDNHGSGAIHFPKWRNDQGIDRELGDEYYKQFVSERYQEIKPGLMGWKKIRDRNEVLDVFIYATALGYIDNIANWDDLQWDSYKNEILALS